MLIGAMPMLALAYRSSIDTIPRSARHLEQQRQTINRSLIAAITCPLQSDDKPMTTGRRFVGCTPMRRYRMAILAEQAQLFTRERSGGTYAHSRYNARDIPSWSAQDDWQHGKRGDEVI